MIEVENLTKLYGSFPAIEDVSFTVSKGEVVGFLGPNGAGKSTTMRILTCFMPPTSGMARIGGHDVVDDSLEVRKLVGYMPEAIGEHLYTDMTVTGYLDYLGTLRGMSRAHRVERIDEVIGICHLEEYEDSLIGRLSKGFRQRVGVAQAILHEPQVLILDEPTVGIDPLQVVETRQLIRGLGKDHTLLLSTHVLSEVSAVCEKVLIIHEGRIVAQDRPENLSARLQGSERIQMDIRGPSKGVIGALREIRGVKNVSQSEGSGERGRYLVECRPGVDLREELAATVIQRKWGLLGLQPLGLTLEEIFLKLTSTPSEEEQ